MGGTEIEINSLSDKLNLIASLLIDIKQSLSEKMSVKDKVNYLVKRGVTQDDDISAILSINRGHASKEKALLKKVEKNGREPITL